MKLSPHELAWLAARAGFTSSPAQGLPTGVTGTEIEVFTATCIGESGLDSEVIARSTDSASPNLGNRDHGLAQISGRWHWDKVQAAGGNWRDPATNVAIAYQVFVAGGKPPTALPTDPSRPRTFWPWSVFVSGAFKTYLPDAKIAAAHPWPWVDPLGAQLAPVLAERDAAKAAAAAAQAALVKVQDELAAVTAKLAAVRTAVQDG